MVLGEGEGGINVTLKGLGVGEERREREVGREEVGERQVLTPLSSSHFSPKTRIRFHQESDSHKNQIYTRIRIAGLKKLGGRSN